jgi:hypothetical protein
METERAMGEIRDFKSNKGGKPARGIAAPSCRDYRRRYLGLQPPDGNR